MDYSNRWEIIREIGEGGQGKVYRVLDKQKFHSKEDLIKMTKASIINFSAIQTEKMKDDDFKLFKDTVLQIAQMEDPVHHGALKILHEAAMARDAKKGKERIKFEIEAMVSISHPNLLKILDVDPESKWFVSKFYPKGTLDKNVGFIGDFPKALRAIRPLVEGVSKLHGNKKVHRDIKPQNIFIDSNDNLVLGDFGLIFFQDEKHTRISETFENVGSRDWMPAWAYGMRIEDISPCFDVFSLGKVLWSMISGRPILRLWYFEKDQFNLEKMFPKSRFMSIANRLLRKCVVEEEKNCLTNAMALLAEIDQMLCVIDNNADLLDSKIERICKVCGIGKYTLLIDQDSIQMQTYGIRPTAGCSFKAFVCDNCGHFELFLFEYKKGTPPAWGERSKKIDLQRKAQIL